MACVSSHSGVRPDIGDYSGKMIAKDIAFIHGLDTNRQLTFFPILSHNERFKAHLKDSPLPVCLIVYYTSKALVALQ
jgi:hypothetical protein